MTRSRAVLSAPWAAARSRWLPATHGWALAAALAFTAPPILADPTPGAGAHGGPAPLHFSHPLVAESPSPDTKLRLDGFLADGSGDQAGQWSTVRLEAELALRPGLSLEVDVPYTFRDPAGAPDTDHLDTVEIGVKGASFAFAEHGLLVGGGLEVGLPTGSDSREIGSSRTVEFEPFVDAGWRRGPWQLVAFFSVGILHNEPDDEAESEIAWNLSVLHEAHPRLQLLLELDGERVNGGDEDGADRMHVTPGLKVRPLPERPLWLGLGVSVPVSHDEKFDARGVLSAFWHF